MGKKSPSNLEGTIEQNSHRLTILRANVVLWMEMKATALRTLSACGAVHRLAMMGALISKASVTFH